MVAVNDNAVARKHRLRTFVRLMSNTAQLTYSIHGVWKFATLRAFGRGVLESHFDEDRRFFDCGGAADGVAVLGFILSVYPSDSASDRANRRAAGIQSLLD